MILNGVITQDRNETELETNLPNSYTEEDILTCERKCIELKKILLLPVTLAALVNTCKPCSTNTVFKYYALTALTKYFSKDKHGPGTSSFLAVKKIDFSKMVTPRSPI